MGMILAVVVDSSVDGGALQNSRGNRSPTFQSESSLAPLDFDTCSKKYRAASTTMQALKTTGTLRHSFLWQKAHAPWCGEDFFD